MTVIPIVICVLGTVTKELVQELDDLEIRRRVETIQATVLLRSAKDTKKSLGDLRRFVVTKTPAETHQLTLVQKKISQ